MNAEDLHSQVLEKLSNDIQSQALAEPKILKIVLIGKTGEGKSSTGNSLLKEKKFSQKFGQRPGTIETSGVTTTIKVDGTEYQLMVIDTPGLFDTSDQEEVKAQVRRCIDIDTNHSNALTGSIHAFFLVMKADSRFTPEMQNTLDVVATTFGGLHMNPYLFVVFTRADEMAANRITEEEFMREYVDPEVLKKIEETGNDPIFVNNIDSNGDQIDTWRQNVVRRIVSNLERRVPHVPYSYLHFSAAPIQSEASQLRRMFEKLMLEKDELSDNLKQFEVKYKNLGKTAGATGMAGAAVNLGVGVPLMVAGIVFAVPSLGLSAILTGAGAAVCTAGGVIQGGAAIHGKWQRTKLDQQAEHTVNSFFETAIQLSKELDQVRRKLLDAKIRLWPTLLVLKLREVNVQAQAEISEIHLADSGIVSMTSARFLTGASQTALMTALLSSDTILKLVGTAVRVVPIVGTAVGAAADLISFAISLDRHFKSEEYAKEKFDELRNKLDKFIKEIQAELETLLAELEEFCSKPEESCMCIICRDLWDIPVVCPATQMHISGCQKCVAKWHLEEESPSCPICRLPWSNISTTPDENCDNESKP